MTTSKDQDLARQFRALSHPRRAMIFRLLAERPDAGQTFQHLQIATRLCDSSLVHHLREMERCGVIQRHRKGSRVAHVLETSRLTAALQEALRISGRAQSPARRVA